MPTIDQNTEYVLKKIRANAGRRGEVTCVSVLVSSFLALIVMMTAPDVTAQSVAASQSDRRAQAPAVAVTSDGSVHAVWFDKGAVGECP